MPRWMHSGWFLTAVVVGFLALGAIPIVGHLMQRGKNAGDTADVTILRESQLTEFIDHPERFKGKTLRATLTVRSATFAERGGSLRSYAGNVAEFGAFGTKSEQLPIRIKMPTSNSIPAVVTDDTVVVTFVCREGQLHIGNEAINVSRP